MILICWLRRTGATTWRSFPPLQMIIAIIIVMFYSIFFCCSIWTLIRVCVGHTPRHPTSIIPLPHTSRGLTRLPAPTSACTVASVDASTFGGNGTEGRSGFKKSRSQLDFLWTSTLPSSVHHALGSGLVHPVSHCRWIVAVSFFNPSYPSAIWYCWVVLLLIFLSGLHATFSVRQKTDKKGV